MNYKNINRGPVTVLKELGENVCPLLTEVRQTCRIQECFFQN